MQSASVLIRRIRRLMVQMWPGTTILAAIQIMFATNEKAYDDGVKVLF